MVHSKGYYIYYIYVVFKSAYEPHMQSLEKKYFEKAMWQMVTEMEIFSQLQKKKFPSYFTLHFISPFVILLFLNKLLKVCGPYIHVDTTSELERLSGIFTLDFRGDAPWIRSIVSHIRFVPKIPRQWRIRDFSDRRAPTSPLHPAGTSVISS